MQETPTIIDPNTPTFMENVVDAIQSYLKSFWGGLKYRSLWKNINTYCLFIGYSRSGHSSVGALLDAHPNVRIVSELGDLKYANLGFKRWQIYYLLLKKAKSYSDKDKTIGGYKYYVPNQWQGKFTELKIAGNKQGEETTRRIQESHRYLERLRKTIKIPIKFIHVVRNPYDNISTMCKKDPTLEGDLEKSIFYYFSLCETIADLKKTLNPPDLFELRHEDYIQYPKYYLKEICEFLGVETTQEYLEDCAKIVYKSPNKSRHSIAWNPEQIEQVQTKINQYSFLSGYTYDN
jgi:hypothetical protein